MDDPIRCLYNFVCENRMGSVHNDPEYKLTALQVDKQTEELEKTLTQEQKLELNQLLSGLAALGYIEDEYMFRAALVVARELNSIS